MKNKFLITFTGFVTLLFSFLVALNFSPFLRGPAPYPPDWQWAYQFTNTFSRIWLPLLVSGVIGWLYFQTTQDKNVEKRENVLIAQFVFLFFLFQLSVIFFQRAGVAVLLHRIIDPGLNGYFTTGIKITNIQIFLQTYTSHVLSFYQHAQGHPPFAVLLFYVLEQFFSLFPKIEILNFLHFSNPDITLIWHNLNNSQKLTALFSTTAIPFFSALTLIPLYKGAKLFYGVRIAFTAALLYIAVPSVTLFTPLNDVFLPLFTPWFLYYLIKGIQQKTNFYFFLSGLIFSISLNFSLTFLPLLLLIVCILFFKRKPSIAFGNGIIFFIGFCIIPLVFLIFFRLNFIELAKTLMSGLPIHRSYKTWVLYNVYDFSVFCGIPLSILFLANLKKQLLFLKEKSLKKLDIIFLSFVLTILLLDLSGSVRGEVGRIWLPFVPLVTMGASSYLAGNKISTRYLLVLFALQIFQLLIMQEFWVTLY